MNISKLNEIFNNHTNYHYVNNLNHIKLRNNKLKLTNTMFYRFSYSQIDITQQSIVSKLNFKFDNNHTRIAYLKKEKNINVDVYRSLFNNITNISNGNNNSKKLKVFGIDGVYNNHKNDNSCLNMGYFDITNNIPINVTLNKDNRTGEVNQLIKYITENKNAFRNVIIVADRLYSNYKLINFLIENKIKFVIRLKNNLKNLNTKIKSNKVRVLKSKIVCDKKVNSANRKKPKRLTYIKYINEYKLITNLSYHYNNNAIKEIYKSRWEIEVYFKLLKYNFKFSKLTEKDIINYEKNYICALIISHIVKMIMAYYRTKFNIAKNKNNKDNDYNLSNIIKGIYEHILYPMINGNLTNDLLDKFCKSYIVKINNKEDRHFPRFSKTPFNKWYVKGYSESSAYEKIITKILENKTNELNKNLKLIYNRIIEIRINGAIYNFKNNKVR